MPLLCPRQQHRLTPAPTARTTQPITSATPRRAADGASSCVRHGPAPAPVVGGLRTRRWCWGSEPGGGAGGGRCLLLPPAP